LISSEMSAGDDHQWLGEPCYWGVASHLAQVDLTEQH